LAINLSCVLDHYTNWLVIIALVACVKLLAGMKGKQLFRSLNKWNLTSLF
jgi:hypothetical protein